MPAESLRSPPDPPGDETGLAKGASIGRYLVLGLLGRGGMGEVYAAYDPELDRKIAVKLLHARGRGQDDTGGRTRLLREAQAIARLSHPNVVVVYDVGTFADSVFIAMEFVEGNTLGYWLQAATRSWREVLDVFMAAGRGLVAAHAGGLIHRDFKPENVMLTKSGQVRVMDFGLARELGADQPLPAGPAPADAAAASAARADMLALDVDPDATAQIGAPGAAGGAGGAGRGAVTSSSGGYLRVKLTQTGALVGTPAYMAPEQFAGVASDGRTDQFAFCVALYEGLYGRRPFAGETVAALMASVLAGSVTDAPPDSRVPAWIRRILLRGLSTNPDDRFPAMTELLAALARDPAGLRRRWVAVAGAALLVAGMAVGANRISGAQRTVCAGGPDRAASAWAPARREAIRRAFTSSGNKYAERAFAGAAALIDDYVARWTRMYQESCQAAQGGGAPSADILDLRMGCLGERLSGVRALVDVLASADGDVVDNAVSAATGLPSLDRCADVQALRAVIKPPEDPAVRRQVDKLRDDVAKVSALSAAGRCDQAKKIGVPVQQAARQLGYRPLEAEISFALGRLFDTCLDTSEALADLEDAVLAAEASHHDEIAIEASVLLGGAYADLTRDTRAGHNWVRHGEAILARFPGHPLLEARVAVCREIVLFRQGRFEEALRHVQRAQAIQESLLGPKSLDVAMSANNVATVLHELGRDEEAHAHIRRAIDIFADVFGEDTGRVAIASLNECEILTALGRFEAAHAALGKTMKIWTEQSASPFHIGSALLYEGRLRLAEKNPRGAVAALEQALPLLGAQDAHSTAEARFLLARGLSAFPSAASRRRAVDLARQAHAALAPEPAAAGLVRSIEAWQREHDPR